MNKSEAFAVTTTIGPGRLVKDYLFLIDNLQTYVSGEMYSEAKKCFNLTKFKLGYELSPEGMVFTAVIQDNGQPPIFNIAVVIDNDNQAITILNFVVPEKLMSRPLKNLKPFINDIVEFSKENKFELRVNHKDTTQAMKVLCNTLEDDEFIVVGPKGE